MAVTENFRSADNDRAKPETTEVLRVQRTDFLPQ